MPNIYVLYKKKDERYYIIENIITKNIIKISKVVNTLENVYKFMGKEIKVVI